MNSGLLNVWRENGAYLRYGDAKCIFLSGLSIGILFSFLRIELLDGDVTWGIIGSLFSADIGAKAWVAVAAFSLAFVTPTVAIIPSISKNLLRVRLINWVGTRLAIGKSKSSTGDVIYFWGVAQHKRALDYERELLASMDFDGELSAAERNLIEQIWVVSKIATSKFIAANLSIVAILIGLLVSFW